MEIYKVFLEGNFIYTRRPARANIGSSPSMRKRFLMIIKENPGNSLCRNKPITRDPNNLNLKNNLVENRHLCTKKLLFKILIK